MEGSAEAACKALSRVKIEGTEDGISLLNVKSHLFCDYLLHLALYTYSRLRREDVGADIIDNLIDLRLDLERGVKPLENKLQYQIDKVLRAAERFESTQAQANPDPMTFRPKLDALVADDDGEQDDDTENYEEVNRSNVYRPPRIAATLPDLERRQKEERRKSRPNDTLREFVDGEMSNAPIAEASIGSNITSGGRGRRAGIDIESHREKVRRDDVRRYEEENYTRLPSQKQDKTRRGARDRDVYGGEDFRVLDRELYDNVTAKAGTGRGSALDRSRKRPRNQDSTDDFALVGEAFARRKKVLAGRRSTHR
ncbi:hypothetical protein PYCC9005_002110 [Savitreella phatthalungensis]